MKTKTQIENAIKWIEALLSGEYKQGKYKLGNPKKGFCCWGLGCYIVGREFQGSDVWDNEFYNDIGLNHHEAQITPKFYKHDSLVTVNDETIAGFKRIGKYLIKHASTNFNPEVAKGIEKHFNK